MKAINNYRTSPFSLVEQSIENFRAENELVGLKERLLTPLSKADFEEDQYRTGRNRFLLTERNTVHHLKYMRNVRVKYGNE